MSEEKIYSFGDSAGSKSALDPNLLLAMMNNNGGGFGGNGNWMWIIFLFFLYGWGGRGFGGWGNGNGGTDNLINNDYGRELLSQAIAGNRTAISELSTNLNCSVGQIQNAINAVQTSIQSVGNQVGLSSQQVINAIQQGNGALAGQLSQCCCTIQNQLNQCCCDLKEGITRQGYENQLATLNQTNTLGSKIDAGTAALSAQIAAQTTSINEHFCDLEKRELQNRVEALREERTALKGQVDNLNQTNTFAAMLNSATSPIAAAVAGLRSDVDGIKCHLPEVAKVPYSPVVGIPSCVAYNYGLNGFGFNGFGGAGNGFF